LTKVKCHASDDFSAVRTDREPPNSSFLAQEHEDSDDNLDNDHNTMKTTTMAAQGTAFALDFGDFRKKFEIHFYYF
jgi:hypothetical protein